MTRLFKEINDTTPGAFDRDCTFQQEPNETICMAATFILSHTHGVPPCNGTAEKLSGCFNACLRHLPIQWCMHVFSVLPAIMCTEGRSRAQPHTVCACSGSERLRGHEILTFQAWITLPKSLICLLSSGLAVQRRRLNGFQSYIKPVDLRKDEQFPMSKIRNTTKSLSPNFRPIVPSFVQGYFLLLLVIVALGARWYP